MRQRITERTLSRKAEGEIWDELLPGFGVRIGKRKRTYFVMGRVDGRQVRRTVGTTATMKLAQAREKARGMLANFAAGKDPEEAARAAKLEAARARRNTFAAVADDYMQEVGRHRKDAHERQRKLDKEILPVLGHLPVAGIRRADIKALVLDKAKDAPVMAARIKSLIHAILDYAVDEELIEANPAARIRLPPEKPRARYLSELEIRNFWRGLGTNRADRVLKLLLLLGQRRNEVAHMRWDELDLDKGVWEIPAERTKAGRAHRVPLSPLAIELIGAPGEADHEHVFCRRLDGTPITGQSVTMAMQRQLPALGLADKPATPHDLRRTFASQLAELGIDRLTISKLLNHADPTITGAVYELSEHWDKKRAAMLAWSDRLDEIVSGRPAPSNVTQLGAVR